MDESILNRETVEKTIVDNFHKLFYIKKNQTWGNMTWMGVELQKNPLDLFIYQEIFFEVRPQIIIETGTFKGGSAYYFAHLCDILGGGKIITIDNNLSGSFDLERPFHPRIEYLLGSSINLEIIKHVTSQVSADKKVLVILDSDHTKEHVLREMNIYDKFVSKNSYMIVEDSNVNGHPVFLNYGPGPYEAIDEFLQTNTEFIIDKSKEKFMFTLNPNGYLKKL